jgi:hypothetical protein
LKEHGRRVTAHCERVRRFLKLAVKNHQWEIPATVQEPSPAP